MGYWCITNIMYLLLSFHIRMKMCQLNNYEEGK